MYIHGNLPNEEVMRRNHEIVKKEVKEKKEREIENNKNINISVQFMAKELTLIMENLIVLNQLIQNSNKGYKEVIEELKEQKNIEADIYSVLMESKIESEHDRINAAKKLSNIVQSGISVSANLSTLASQIAQYNL